RARDPVPRRADGGRRRRTAQGHVGRGAGAARRRRHHHSHHALPRRSRGDGRPHRRHQQWRDDPGREEVRADAQARQEAPCPPGRRQAGGRSSGACRLQPGDRRGRPRADLRVRHARRAHRCRHAARRLERGRRSHPRPAHQSILARGDLRRPRQRHAERAMNFRAVAAIYSTEMMRTGRTLAQSIVSPVVSTVLYFVVFGAAIGTRISEIEGVDYGAFIVPGLIMMTLLMQSVMNASFGIYFPRFVGSIYELLSAPMSYFEIVLGYVGAAATKSVILGTVILLTSFLFVPVHIAHPFWMVTF